MVDVEEMDESEKDEAAKQDSLTNDNNDSGEGMEEREEFSLLRPGVMEEVRARDEEPMEISNIVLPAEKDTPTIEEPVETDTSDSIVPVPVEEHFEALAISAKKGTRARSSRPSTADGDDDTEGFVDQNVTLLCPLADNMKLKKIRRSTSPPRAVNQEQALGGPRRRSPNRQHRLRNKDRKEILSPNKREPQRAVHANLRPNLSSERSGLKQRSRYLLDAVVGLLLPNQRNQL
jgi:hypothetical protein